MVEFGQVVLVQVGGILKHNQICPLEGLVIQQISPVPNLHRAALRAQSNHQRDSTTLDLDVQSVDCLLGEHISSGFHRGDLTVLVEDLRARRHISAEPFRRALGAGNAASPRTLKQGHRTHLERHWTVILPITVFVKM